MKEYYLQHQKKYVGNSMLWYAKNGMGYTTRPENAHVFTKEEAEKEVKCSSGKYRAWNKEHIDNSTSIHVDSQNVDVSESFESSE